MSTYEITNYDGQHIDDTDFEIVHGSAQEATEAMTRWAKEEYGGPLPKGCHGVSERDAYYKCGGHNFRVAWWESHESGRYSVAVEEI